MGVCGPRGKIEPAWSGLRRSGRRVGGVRLLVVLLVLPVGSGCIVSQPRGAGRVLHLSEASTGAGYYLYLPADYRGSDPAHPPATTRATGAKRPLVVTFHGMKPFDTAKSQIREWQQEADRYGFVVCAPQLRAPDITKPPPLDRVTSSLRRDEAVTLAIMDEIVRTTDVNPAAVLATSWSYGGYIAHYMVNRHPDRFSCLAVKQSNFNADLLDEVNVAKYRDMPIAVFYTENDLGICRRESMAAGNWYAQRGFDITFARFASHGHVRTPGPAGAFFARVCGVPAKSPPFEVAYLQVLSSDVLAARATTTTVGAPPRGPGRVPAAGRSSTGSLPGDAAGTAADRDSPVRIRVSRTIDVAPLLLTYQVHIDDRIAEGASVVWLIGAEPVSSGISGQKLLTEAGDHVLSVVVTDRTGVEHRASEVVTVLERLKAGG